MTTIFTTTQNPETLYTSPPQSSEREFSDGLVGAAEIAQQLKVPISWVYERTPQGYRTHAPFQARQIPPFF